MGCHKSMINGTITQAALAEMSDLALTHGTKGSVKGEQCRTLSRWCETQRNVAQVLTEVADVALTHGNRGQEGVVSREDVERRAA